MLTQTAPLPEDDRSDAELAETELSRINAQLRELAAMRNAAAVSYRTWLERMVETFDAFADMGGKERRVIEGAKKALGLPHDADCLEEYGQDGAF